jgi:hypothetical protein
MPLPAGIRMPEKFGFTADPNSVSGRFPPSNSAARNGVSSRVPMELLEIAL